MSKIIWFIVIAFVVRTVFSAFKKAIKQAQDEIAAEKARQEGTSTQAPPASTAPPSAASSSAPQNEDPRAALIRMLAAAGVSPDITKVVESKLDYDDDAAENKTDYDDEAGESSTDYDDDARESSTDYDDDSGEDATDFDDTPPAAPVVWAAPPPPVVYAMPDDTTSSAVNALVRADIESHMKPFAPRNEGHAADVTTFRSRALVVDSVVLDLLLRRHPRNPLFRGRR